METTAQGPFLLRCTGYLGVAGLPQDHFYFLTSDTTLNSFSCHSTPAQQNFCPISKLPHLPKPATTRMGQLGCLPSPPRPAPPFLLCSVYPDPHPLSHISFPSLGSLPTTLQGYENQAHAVTTMDPHSMQQEGKNPKAGESLLVSRT